MDPKQNKVLLLLESVAMIEPDPGNRALLHMATDTLRAVWREPPETQYTTGGLTPLTTREIVDRVGKPVLVQAFPGAQVHIGFIYWDHVEQNALVFWAARGMVHRLNPRANVPCLIFDYVKRARWVHHHKKPTAYCSNCRGEVKETDPLPKCCPECGCLMNEPGKER